MFTKLISVKRFSREVLSFQELVNLIKNNPNKSKIDKIRSLNKLENKKLYDSIKLSLPCIVPSGIFQSLSNEGLEKLSGYLYFDIDNFDTIKELNDTINKLNDTFPISLINKSVGGMGISFLVRVLDIEKYEYSLIYDFIFDKISKKGFNLDKNAKGLCRKMIISSDDEMIINFDTFFEVNDTLLEQFKYSSISKDYKLITSGGSKKERKEEYYYELHDTFHIIPIQELMKQINLESKYIGEIEGEYKIEDMQYHYILQNKEIKDGDKHRIYTRIINGLYYINPNINRTQIYSYLHFINLSAKPPMREERLKKLITYICNKIETNGEIMVKTKTKRIHFNKESKLTKNQKQKLSGKIMGKIKVNKTIGIILRAKEYFLEKGMTYTQKLIAEHTGLGIATIKRHWTKEVIDEEIKFNTEEIIDKLEIIQEDEFFENKVDTTEKIKIKYRGYKEVEIDLVTDEDKKLFMDKIKKLKEFNIEPSERILLELNLFDEHKTWYIYNKYIKKYGYAIQN